MRPFCPKIARHMMVRDDMSRKKGMVSSASTMARVVLLAPPLASQRAKGNPASSSITVTVSAIRSVRRVTSKRPDSNSEYQVFSVGW